MKKLARLGAMGAALATTGCLTVGTGFAAADSIAYTGPGSYNAIMSRYNTSSNIMNYNNVGLTNSNYQTATSGSAYVGGGNSYGNYGHNNYGNYGGNSWRPTYYMMPSNYNGHGNSGNHHNRCNNYGSSNYGGNYGHQNYTSSYGKNHGNYGTSYGNYGHPSYDGNSYGNYGHNYNTYGSNHNYGGNTYGGSAMTGNAYNTNHTAGTVVITNNVPHVMGAAAQYLPSTNDTIYLTGPHSYNTINRQATSNFNETNVNDVTLANSNNQNARSGNAYVTGNTIGGDASTGNASNSNATDFSVGISNN